MTLSKPNHLPNAPSPNIVTSKDQASTYEFGGWGTRMFSPKQRKCSIMAVITIVVVTGIVVVLLLLIFKK